MKEIDFDELDRAVSSLMGEVKPDSNPDIDPATGEPFEKLVELDDLKSPEPVGEQEKLQNTLEPAKSAAPAIKRSGRFMDVVHPSSDMKKPTSMSPVSRQGNEIVPPSSRIAESVDEPISLAEPDEGDEPKEAIFMPQTEKTIAAPDSIEVEEQKKPTSDSWPDPIDLAMDEKEPDTDVVALLPADTESSDEDSVDDSVDDSATQALDEPNSEAPLSSPFITDAKVEKRPLGGYQSDVPLPADGSAVNVANEEDLSVQSPVELNLPAELGADVMAVEAAQTESEEPNHIVIPTEASQPEAAADQTESADQSSGSIPQQYREEPSSDTGETGAIYDTATYHKPLEHPAVKKSGWSVVLWILGLILLGGAGGVAFFYFTTGNKLF